MNILIVTQYFWPEHFIINDLALGLVEYGYNITVLTGIPNYPQGSYYEGYGLFKKRKDNYKGIKIIRTFTISRGNSKGMRLIFNYFSYAFFASLKGLINVKNNYDLIFVYEPSPITVVIPAILIKRKLNIPMVLWVQDLWPESLAAAGNIKSQFIMNSVTKLVKYIYRNCDIILAQSKSFIESIAEKSIEKRMIQFFPNWAENIYEKNIMDSKFPGILPTGLRIVFAGNIGEAQDFPSIVETAKKLAHYKNIQWIIVGDGRKKEWLESEIEASGLKSNFHILGRYPSEMMPSLFSMADILLVSLKNDLIFSKTIPSKLQTYFASGKPVLGMLNGEGAKVIKDAKAGFVSDSGDVDSFIKNIIRFSKLQKNEIEQMSNNARLYYNENFSRIKLLNKLNLLIKSMQKRKT